MGSADQMESAIVKVENELKNFENYGRIFIEMLDFADLSGDKMHVTYSIHKNWSLHAKAARKTVHSMKKHQVALDTIAVQNGKTNIQLNVLVRNKLIAGDEILGKCTLTIGQENVENWFELYSMSDSKYRKDGKLCGKIKLKVSVCSDMKMKRLMDLEQLKKRQLAYQAEMALVEEYQKMMKSHMIHPAYYGEETRKLAMNLDNVGFSIEKVHPGALQKTSFKCNARVITPFGIGKVQSYRAYRRVYGIVLDKGGLANVQASEVSKASAFEIGNGANTPFGTGLIVKTRQDDSVQLQMNGTMAYVQKKYLKPMTKNMKDMSVGELIHEAASLTEKGNAQAKLKNQLEAVKLYIQALCYLNNITQENATQKEKAENLQTMIRCHLNIGVCKFKVQHYQESIIASTNAINVLQVLFDNRTGAVVQWMIRLGNSEKRLFQEWPCKAYYRRAQVFEKLHQYNKAKSDLVQAIKLNPTHTMARKLLDSVSEKSSTQRKKEKKTWGGIFEDSPKANKAEKAESIHEDILHPEIPSSETSPQNHFKLQTWHAIFAATLATASIALLAPHRSNP